MACDYSTLSALWQITAEPIAWKSATVYTGEGIYLCFIEDIQ